MATTIRKIAVGALALASLLDVRCCASEANALDPAILAKLEELKAKFEHLKADRASALKSVREQGAGQEHLLQDHLARLEASSGRSLHSAATMTAADDGIAWNTGNEIANAAAIADLQPAGNHTWLLLCGALVMFMQAGFAMVEAGACRSRNVQNILMKNIFDVCVGTSCWWAVGWTLAYGVGSGENHGFANDEQYFGTEFTQVDSNGKFTMSGDLMLNWFFQWAFCSASATIVSGGVAERVKFPGYLIFTICMTSWIYPVVAHWTWGYGWLSGGDTYQVNGVGFMDFAGSGIVHMCGGVAALVGAAVVGPRKGRFRTDESFDPHSLPLVVLGTFILWFGWYGFNCGSTLSMASSAKGTMAALVAMNTTLSGATAGLAVLMLRRWTSGKFDVGGMCSGILAGLVSITAGCGNVECGSAVLIGFIGALVYSACSSAVLRLCIDDPLDAFAVHGACGAWGVIAAALFDFGTGINFFNGFSGWDCVGGAPNCTAYAWSQALTANVLEVFCIAGWSAGWSLFLFLPLRVAGLLRAPDEIQDTGMDHAKHSPTGAYSM